MIEREERERRQTELVIAKVICDRCGNECRHMTGIGVPDFPFEGAYVRGRLYPTANADDQQRVDQELCGPCTEALREWIEAGG